MDALTAPIPTIRLQQLGDLDAAACEGEFCAMPDHHTQKAVNRQVDDDAV